MGENRRSKVKVSVIGCAGSSFDEELRLACSSYLVESAEAALLLDCGFGSFESFERLASTTRLDAIFVSHAHRDHVMDLEAFMDSPDVWRDQPRLIASNETITLVAPSPDSLPVGTLVVVEEGTRWELAPLTMEFSRTTHQMPTLATHLSIDGHRIVYGADTGPTWIVPRSFVGADLAILECTLETRKPGDSPFHLDSREVGTQASELCAQKVVITHVPPRAIGDTRLAIARGVAPDQNFVLARDGLALVL